MSSVGQLVPQVTRPPNTSVKVNGPHIDGSLCSFIDYDYDPVISIICAMYIVFGTVYTLFGYRCFKASMFLTGFTFGSAVVYLICLQEHLMPPYGNVGVALCAGLLFGLITMLIQYVGLFMTGFHSGLLLAVAGLVVYDQFLETRPNTYWLCIVTLLVSGIFFAVINLYWKKALTVVGTSVYGGAVIATCLDYFLERMIMLKWVWERVKLEPWGAGRGSGGGGGWSPCARSWVALAAWPAAALLGLAVQATLTAAGTHHSQSISAQKRRLKSMQPRPATREQRAEMRQRKYRYLYQVRTAHGDVISQSYVQALQKKAQCSNWGEEEACGSGGGGRGEGGAGAGGGGECSTLQSDSTHLTVVAGSDLAPHTDSEDDLHHTHTHTCEYTYITIDPDEESIPLRKKLYY